MFTPKHIVIMLIVALIIAGLTVLTRKWALKSKYKAFLGVALVSETVKVFFYILDAEDTHGGILPKIDLPFHLCSIQILFALAYFIFKSERVKRAIAAFMMPSGLIGGLAAVLIPAYPALDAWVITFQYFIYHAVLMTLALNIMLSKELKLTVKDYATCMIFVVALMFVSIYVNSITYNIGANGGINPEDVNFMYVVSPPQPGLPYLTEEHGWGVYIVHLAAAVFAAITVCYIKPIFVAIRSLFTKRKGQSQPVAATETAVTADEQVPTPDDKE